MITNFRNNLDNHHKFKSCVNFRDRMRTTNNLLGDCYACAVIEKLSQKELSENFDVSKTINLLEIVLFLVNNKFSI